jgi:hypothetical protein
LIDNLTEESLIQNLGGNPSLLIRADEFVRLLDMLGKYNGSNSMSFFLENYNNKDYTKTRIGSEPVHLAFTAAPVLGGIQPKILLRSFKQEDAESGLLARFLFVGYWEDIVQPFIPSTEIPSGKSDSHREYERAILRVQERFYTLGESIRVTLDEDATTAFDDYRREIHGKCLDDPDSPLLTYRKKSDTNVPRFITLSVALRLAYEDPSNETELSGSLVATQEDVEFAVGLDRYFEHMHSELSTRMRSIKVSDNDFARELLRRTIEQKKSGNDLLNQKQIAALAGISPGQVSKLKKATSK